MSDGVTTAPAVSVNDVMRVPNTGEKATKAAREFETILLTSWLEQVQQGLHSMGQQDQDAGADTTNSMALQALAAGVAAGGGLGLAKMMLKSLPVTTGENGASQNNLQKVLKSPERLPITNAGT